MITLRHLSKTFNSGDSNEISALKDIGLEIPTGEFVVILGANGSGKTTLFNLISGHMMADQGKIIVDGTDLSHLREYQRTRWITRIFQNPLSGTSSGLSILDNFRLASLRTRRKGFRIGTGEKFRSLVRDKISILNLGLENKLDQSMGTLSGGQRQALTLVMATMDKAKIMLLDVFSN